MRFAVARLPTESVPCPTHIVPATDKAVRGTFSRGDVNADRKRAAARGAVAAQGRDARFRRRGGNPARRRGGALRARLRVRP